MKVFAVANQKGGVGKTTSCVNLSAVLAESGRRVLMVDMDPQAGLTVSWGYDPDTMPLTTYDLLVREGGAVEHAIVSIDGNLGLIPSNLDLSAAEAELMGETGWDRVLRDILVRIQGNYDYAVIDCPPSLGVLTTNAFMASDMIIVPVQSEYLAMRGLRQLQKIIHRIKKKGNPSVSVRILRTMHDARTVHSAEIVEELKRVFGEQVFNVIIKRSVRFPESVLAGKPITRYAGSSPGAAAYRELAREVVAL